MPETTRIGDVLADLDRLLEPHLVVTELAWLPLAGVVTVEAWVNTAMPPAGVPTQADMRAALFASAQEVIRAVEDADYSHDEQPVIHIDGDEQQGENGTEMIQIRGSVAFQTAPAGLGRLGKHLIRRDLQPRPLPAHSDADLLKYSSTMRSERQP
jgi:hypothetical protein